MWVTDAWKQEKSQTKKTSKQKRHKKMAQKMNLEKKNPLHPTVKRENALPNDLFLQDHPGKPQLHDLCPGTPAEELPQQRHRTGAGQAVRHDLRAAGLAAAVGVLRRGLRDVARAEVEEEVLPLVGQRGAQYVHQPPHELKEGDPTLPTLLPHELLLNGCGYGINLQLLPPHIHVNLGGTIWGPLAWP